MCPVCTKTIKAQLSPVLLPTPILAHSSANPKNCSRRLFSTNEDRLERTLWINAEVRFLLESRTFMGPFPVRLPTWAAMKKYQGPPDRRTRPDRAMVSLMELWRSSTWPTNYNNVFPERLLLIHTYIRYWDYKNYYFFNLKKAFFLSLRRTFVELLFGLGLYY